VASPDVYSTHLAALRAGIVALRKVARDAEVLEGVTLRTLIARIADVTKELEALAKAADRTQQASVRSLLKDFNGEAAVVRALRRSGSTKYDFHGYLTALKKSSRDLTDQLDRIEQFAHSEQARLSRRRSTLRERAQRPIVSLDVDRFPAAEPPLRHAAGDDE
jgi:hypothetical protein